MRRFKTTVAALAAVTMIGGVHATTARLDPVRQRHPARTGVTGALPPDLAGWSRSSPVTGCT